MIVAINKENSDKYRKLFADSYEYLKGLENSPVDPNKDRFNSLTEYYGHMADFFNNRKYKYVMLPLDEETFNIDLNTRTINVPASFSKCASVQSDQLAETIVFVVDRYFDHMDLANVSIFVQWTIPENKKDGIEEYHGATPVEMIDLESDPDKIKFAWPLNYTITEHPGTVRFSVRFVRVDEDNKVLYSLNTIDSSIVIKPALQPHLTDKANIESDIGREFQKAILNSVYSDTGVSAPVMPEFIEPGSDITCKNMFEVGKLKIANLEDDTLSLYVQAYTADTSEVEYKWYYSADNDKYYDCEHYPITFDEDGEPVTYGSFGTINNYTYIVCDPQPTVRVPHEIYYEEIGSAMKEYTGEIDEVTAATKILYERYSSFTVPEEIGVTGNYYAAAWGYVTDKSGKVVKTPYSRSSSVCVIPGPSTILFKANGDLTNGKVLRLNADEEYEETLSVQVVTDEYQPVVNYVWRRSTASPEDVIDPEFTALVDANEANLTVSEPGWYAVEVKSTLNRETKNKFSNICKVTKSPAPPVVTPQESRFVDITGATKENPQEFTINAEVYNPLNYDEDLLRDSFEYVWQMQNPDTDKFITIKEGTLGIDGLGSHTLKVDNRLKYTGATFRCLVINHLNGEKAVFDHTGKYDGSDMTLGMFKQEAPYIYDNEILHFAFSVKNY